MTRSAEPPDAHPLQVALRQRAVVAQATGVVMATQGCRADEALALLGATAAERQCTLVEVAAGVVDAVRPGPG